VKEIDKLRLGLLPALAERSATGHIGRTALMKYMYFLQTVRKVGLRYQFSLYSYGPFDADVLADLSSAETLEIVNVTPVQFSGGYGYEIRPGRRAEEAKREIGSFLEQHEDDLRWLFAVFGGFNSAELELASTIVYVDREFAETKQAGASTEEIVARVREIKPHFAEAQIGRFVLQLLKERILTSTAAQDGAKTN